MKSLAVIAALTLAPAAFAGELVVHLISHHSDYNRDTTTDSFNKQSWQWETTNIRAYNNQNFGVGYVTDDSWTLGVYHNSYYHASAYFGRQFLWDTPLALFDRPVRAGGMLLVATGYPQRTLQPFPGLQLNVPVLPMVDAVLVAAPPVAGNNGVVHLALTYRL